MPIIAPSILAADFARLEQALKQIEAAGADWVHCDIMDGHFVPNLSFGLPVLSAIDQTTDLPLDVHLMIQSPERYLESFARAGANILTVHFEACIHLHRTLVSIRQLGLKSGVAVNPHTPVELLRDVLSEVDIVCLMAVNPGFGGQQFIDSTYDRLARLSKLRTELGVNFLIEVDGGVDGHNAKRLRVLGSDVLVAGNYFFSHPNTAEAVKLLRGTDECTLA